MHRNSPTLKNKNKNKVKSYETDLVTCNFSFFNTNQKRDRLLNVVAGQQAIPVN